MIRSYILIKDIELQIYRITLKIIIIYRNRCFIYIYINIYVCVIDLFGNN